jgi:hypothetical protein
MNAYGFSYNFTYSGANPAPPPGGSWLIVSMDCLQFTETPYTAGVCPFNAGPLFLTSGQFFNPPDVYPLWRLDANASFINGVMAVRWVDLTGGSLCNVGCESDIDSYYNIPAVLVSPEPGTIVLVASGLGLVGTLSLRRRSRRGWSLV